MHVLLTAGVTRIYTNMAVIHVTPAGLRLVEVAPGFTRDDVQVATDAELHIE